MNENENGQMKNYIYQQRLYQVDFLYIHTRFKQQKKNLFIYIHIYLYIIGFIINIHLII